MVNKSEFCKKRSVYSIFHLKGNLRVPVNWILTRSVEAIPNCKGCSKLQGSFSIKRRSSLHRSTNNLHRALFDSLSSFERPCSSRCLQCRRSPDFGIYSR